MALSKAGLKQRVLDEFDAQGFDTSNEHCWANKFAEALANAVIDEITQNAVVTAGEHTGTVS